VSSKLTYNGITLPFCDTQQFAQAVVRDDSGTDRKLHRFDIVVNCLISSDFLALVAPDLLDNATPRTTSAAEIMGVIRSRLLADRKALSFTFNGVELLPKKADVQGTVDAENGPKANYCNVLELNTACFMVQFSVTAHYWENNTITPGGATIRVNKKGNPVVSHRWTERVSIDVCNYTTRTREGKIVIRSDNEEGTPPDELRASLCVLGIPDGWVRRQGDYTITPDGLGLAYTVVDQEVFRPPPWPAYEADGEYTESAQNMGAVRFAEVRCRLRGYKDRPDKPVNENVQYEVMRTAVAVCSSKIQDGRRGTQVGQKKTSFVLENASVSIGLYDSWVQCTMRARYETKKGAITNVVSPEIVRMEFSQPDDPAPEYPVYGGAGILLKAAAYYDPSITGVTVNPQTRQQTRGKTPGTAGEGE
jgi:hypothetical protein